MTKKTAQRRALEMAVGFAFVQCLLGSPTAALATTDPQTLVIKDMMFSKIVVHPGQRFLVNNADRVDHTLKIAGTTTDAMIHGQSFLIVTAPAKVGSYILSCDYNRVMRGRLTVSK